MKFKCDGIVEIRFDEPENGKPKVIVDFGENSWEIYGEGWVDESRGIIVSRHQIPVP